MFCPNCGAQNSESATTCQKCNFNLKGAAAPKFKGTMLMMNQPPLPDMPGAPAAPPAASPPAGPAAPPMPPRIKGTMVGMAPPPEAFGASPSTSQPVAQPFSPSATPAPLAPAPFAPFAPQGAPPGASQQGAPAQSPVNPLGGTLAVDQLNFGAFPGGEIPGAPPGFGPAAEPPPPTPAFGGESFGGGQANQPGYGGFAPPAANPAQGFGQPGQPMGYGGQQGPSGGYGPPPGGFGGPPGGYGGPPQGYGGEPVNTQTALILAFVSIFCGCPGLFAAIPIFFAFQAKTLAEEGRHEEARAKVKLVKIIVFTGMGLYAVFGIVWFLIFGLALLSR